MPFLIKRTSISKLYESDLFIKFKDFTLEKKFDWVIDPDGEVQSDSLMNEKHKWR